MLGVHCGMYTVVYGNIKYALYVVVWFTLSSLSLSLSSLSLTPLSPYLGTRSNPNEIKPGNTKRK